MPDSQWQSDLSNGNQYISRPVLSLCLSAYLLPHCWSFATFSTTISSSQIQANRTRYPNAKGNKNASSGKVREMELETLLKWSGLVWLTNKKLTGGLLIV